MNTSGTEIVVVMWGLPKSIQTIICFSRLWRHLSADIASEWESTENNPERRQRLLALTNEIIPFLMRHNAEADACDLLMEIEQLDLIETFVDKDTHPRVCLYLTR